MRYSSGNDLKFTRMLKLHRERKCLKKVPNKNVEHYSEDSTILRKERRLESPQITNGDRSLARLT